MDDVKIFSQIVVISTSKQLLAQQVDEEKVLRIQAERDMHDSTKKNQATRLKLEVQLP